MPHRAALFSILLLLTAPACDDGDDPPDAAARDRSVEADRGAVADSTPPDAMPDAMPDAAPDAERPSDAAVDAAPDAVPDAMADAAPDALPDALPDAVPEPDMGPPWIGDGVCDPSTVIPLRPIDRASGSTTGAPSGADPSCSDGGGAGERVFTWVAPEDGVACLSLAEATFDTVLYVRRDPCNAADAELACNDDDPDLGVQSALSMQVQAGVRYFAFVDGYAGGQVAASGDFVLEIGAGPCRNGGRLRCMDDAGCPAGRVCDGAACTECVDDDDCADGFRCSENRCEPGPMMGEGACSPDRLVELDGFTAHAGDNRDAPVDDVGSCNPGTLGPEVAHRFVADADGPVCARTLGSPMDTVVYVRGACAEPDSERVCHDDVTDDELTSAADFDAVAGEPVFIFVDTYTLDDVGDYVLAVVPGPCAEAPVCGEGAPCPDGQMCAINACLTP